MDPVLSVQDSPEAVDAVDLTPLLAAQHAPLPKVEYPPLLLVRHFYLDLIPPMHAFIRAFEGTDQYNSAQCSDFSPMGKVIYTCYGDAPADIWIMAESQESTDEKRQWIIFKKSSDPIKPILQLDDQFYCDLEQEWRCKNMGTYTLRLDALDFHVLHKSKSTPPTRDLLCNINFVVHRLLNTAHHMPAKRVFLQWLRTVSPYLPKVKGVECLAELSVHYARDSQALEIVGHMFYALIHVFGLNSKDLEPLLLDLTSASVVCAPIMLERLHCDQSTAHKGLMLHALSNMTKLNKAGVVDIFATPGAHVTGFKDFLLQFSSDPEFKTTERLQCLRVILAAIASSDAATDNLMDALEPVFCQLQDVPQLGILLRPFASRRTEDGRDEDEVMIEKLGQWWDKLNITMNEQLMLEDRIPPHCHYISSVNAQIMRVPATLQVDKTHTSVYEAADIRRWFLVDKGRIDPDTNIPVRFKRHSLQRALQVDHARLREIRNWVTENLEIIRSPGLGYAVVRAINSTVIYPLRLICREVYENGRFVTVILVIVFAIFWIGKSETSL